MSSPVRYLAPRSISFDQLRTALQWREDWIQGGSIMLERRSPGSGGGGPSVPQPEAAVIASQRFQEGCAAIDDPDDREIAVAVVLQEAQLGYLASEWGVKTSEIAKGLRVALDQIAGAYASMSEFA